MPVSLALYQPDIPQNTGTLIRLCACFNTPIHIIHPCGFPFSNKHLRRAGMDYIDLAEIIEHNSFSAFQDWRMAQNKRLVLLTTNASQSGYDTVFQDEDILMVGRESAGVPQEVAALADLSIRIPMAEHLRSINVAIAASLMLGEANRQTNGFQTLS